MFHGLYISETRIFAHVFRRITWREDVARSNITNKEFMDISIYFSNWINVSSFARNWQWKVTNNTTVSELIFKHHIAHWTATATRWLLSVLRVPGRPDIRKYYVISMNCAHAHVTVTWHMILLLTTHNQESTQMSPDPLLFGGGVWGQDYVLYTYLSKVLWPMITSYNHIVTKELHTNGN